MAKTIKEQLLSCKSYDDARPILETIGAGLSAHTLLKTAFNIQDKQPTVAHQFIGDVIREMEDEEDKKVKESDGGVSHEASSTTGLEKVGSESDAAESASAQTDKKDQMGVAINEMGGYPPQQMAGGFPPQGGAPPSPCGGGQPQPPMPPQGGQTPQQQMQYTVQEVQRQFAPQFKQIAEALKALDKKVQETAAVQPKSLELSERLGGKGMHSSYPMIKETTERSELSQARFDIEHMNDMINSGKY